MQFSNTDHDHKIIINQNEYSLTHIILDDSFQTTILQHGLKSKLSNPTTVFKLVLLGNRGVGKSSFTNRFQSRRIRKILLETCKLSETYFATITTVQFIKPRLDLEIWELETQNIISAKMFIEILSNEDCLFMKNVDFVMLMFKSSISSRTFNSIPYWWEIGKISLEKRGLDFNNRMILCGMKVDMNEGKVKPPRGSFHLERTLRYFNVSSIVNHNVLTCVEYLLRQVNDEWENIETFEQLKQYDGDSEELYKTIELWEDKLYHIKRAFVKICPLDH